MTVFTIGTILLFIYCVFGLSLNITRKNGKTYNFFIGEGLVFQLWIVADATKENNKKEKY